MSEKCLRSPGPAGQGKSGGAGGRRRGGYASAGRSIEVNVQYLVRANLLMKASMKKHNASVFNFSILGNMQRKN